MPTFAYRLLPPREDFVATMTEAEGALMARHFGVLQACHAAGTIRFAGLCEGGDWAVCVFDAPDLAAAEGFAQADPAVAEGLMRAEVRPFRVVFGAPGAS